MNYNETVDYLFTRLPMFSRIGAAAYKEDLNNTIRLCAELGDPQHKFKCVHIAGTNGKGSVSHMLAAIFQTAGYKTGLYTSPHLRDFRERIRINGEMITEDFVVDFTARIKTLSEEIEPSFFEITVAMAFDYFASSGIDIAIIETGLGGRLDSTNIVMPELAVITNIGMDHKALLGDTLSLIAGEKAGIIKKDTPVVVGEVLPETLPVFESRARQLQASLTIASQTRQAIDWNWQKHELVVEVATAGMTDHSTYHLDLPGLYQTKNLLTVLETCARLQQRGWKITDEITRIALRQVRKLTGLHGRWEIIHSNPMIVLDVAHNEDGIKQLMEQVEITDHEELRLVIGFVKDKEVDNILGLLPHTAHFYFTQAQIPRALPAAELAIKASSHGLKGKKFDEANQALEEARRQASEKDLVIVCGSVFLVGEIR